MRSLYREAARLGRWCGGMSLVLILAAGLLTVGDILLRSVTGKGVLGTTDLTQLLIMAAAFVAIPYGFFADSHVAVDLATERLHPRKIAMIKAAAALLAVAVFALAGAFGFSQARLEHGYGDASPTIQIPKLWYWVWLVGGSALAGLAALITGLRQAFLALGERDIGHG